jgi:hypothetical protein
MTYQVYDGGLDLVQPISQSLTFTSGGPIHLSAVPEPSTSGMLLISILLTGMVVLFCMQIWNHLNSVVSHSLEWFAEIEKGGVSTSL